MAERLETDAAPRRTREEKIAEARELRAQGLTHREIGERFGVTGGCVTKWLNPRAREWARKTNAAARTKKREWERAWMRSAAGRGTCVECGEPRGVGTAKKGDGLCVSCIAKRVQRRREEIARRWDAGESARQIAAALSTTRGTIAEEIRRMRAGGWELRRGRKTFG